MPTGLAAFGTLSLLMLLAEGWKLTAPKFKTSLTSVCKMPENLDVALYLGFIIDSAFTLEERPGHRYRMRTQETRV